MDKGGICGSYSCTLFCKLIYSNITTSEKEIYKIWRKRNPHTRPSLDSNKLAAVKRNILNKQRVTNNEIAKIKFSIANKLAANQSNVFTYQSTSAARELINELTKPKISVIRTEAHQEAIEEIPPLSDQDNTF